MLDLSQSAAGPLIWWCRVRIPSPFPMSWSASLARLRPVQHGVDSGQHAGGLEGIGCSNQSAAPSFRRDQGRGRHPDQRLPGKWVVAGADTIATFSAVGYYFGKFLQEGIKAPVGMILSAWGGTPIETWTSRDALVSDPEIAEGVEKREDDLRTYSRRIREYLLAMSDWQDANQRQDHPQGLCRTISTGSPPTIPGKIGDAGAVWLRRTVDITPDQATRPLLISINEGTTGIEQVFWNGKPIGSASLEQTTKSRAARRYTVPASALAPGRVRSRHSFLSSRERPFRLQYHRWQTAIPGTWMKKGIYNFPLSPPRPPRPPAVAPGVEPISWQAASHLFNAMIYPLIPYAIQGVICTRARTISSGPINTGRPFR